ncbi:MAG TPA: hypothetical protein VJX23_08825 [Candidatus Binataceae bacterium]|nr:hypothetical protein [Candidatus Binataceae bacterium]
MEAQTQQAPSAAQSTIAFPSLEWFQHLALLMKQSRALHEHLGYIDCVAQFTVLDGGLRAKPWSAQLTFEEFEAIDVREVGATDAARTDFTVEATLATWREMIENIARGRGRPDLTHTLNYLSHTGAPIRVWSDDPLRKDLFFRYNQSLQEFVNASAAFRTVFPD